MAKDYNHKEIEPRWQKFWEENQTYKTEDKSSKPKQYILDMFPYPSGAGLHVGHPRGYIGSDVLSRMRRMQGFNVLHPMGFDAFGLPAEQYAIQTGEHPSVITEKAIETYKKQLELIGLSYDWSREVQTIDPAYYKWTQWIFLQLFDSYFDEKENKAKPIGELVAKFEKEDAGWKDKSEKEKQDILMDYRLAYEGYSEVNWCEELGTVLANDEIVDDENGKPVSERGGFPVEKKEMRQWFLRITKYADRLLSGLETIDWPEHIKEIQKNWIGKSEGAEIDFPLANNKEKTFLILDFDGVVGDTLESLTKANMIINNVSYDISKKSLVDYANHIPNHIRGGDQKDVDNVADWIEKIGDVMLEQDLRLFSGFVNELESMENTQIAFVSSGSIKYINNLLSKTNLKPTHVLAYEDHHSKEEKVELICKDWGIEINDAYYITDTKADIYELEKIFNKSRFIGCAWGYIGFDALAEVLPSHQIMKEYSDIHRVLNHSIKVFTTRPETIFGVTFLAVSAGLAKKWLDIGWPASDEIKNYVAKTLKENETADFKEREKTGIYAGFDAINPATKENIPIWITNYVLDGVGTGAIMSVPAHDERDFEFAKKFGLPIKVVVVEKLTEVKENSITDYKGELLLKYLQDERNLITAIKQAEKWLDDHGSIPWDGVIVNSGNFNLLTSQEAKSKITEFVGGKMVTKYKMRDAIFARQRYWGEPIPLRHEGELIKPLSEKDLPLKLPNVDSYKPAGNGESPLAGVPEWKDAGYETNTMPGWAGSSWYFLRYMDPKNGDVFAGKEALNYWKDVDVYIGGAEHATGHLLYSRFWHKVLHDLGHVPTEEPFKLLKNQGLILASDGRKMSKRWGNVVNPDEMVDRFGADSFRLYEMFIGPFDQYTSWNTDGLVGTRRFLERVWRAKEKIGAENTEVNILVNKTIKKITEDIENFRFNTSVSSMMILVNKMEEVNSFSRENYLSFLQILAPFAPHMSEELWHELGEKESIHKSGWPKYDAEKIKDEKIKIAIQINGKVRDEIEIAGDASEEEVKSIATERDAVKEHIDGKEIKKFIYVKGKIVNIVI